MWEFAKKAFTNAVLIYEQFNAKDMTHLKEGDKAPDFTGVNEQGEAVSLADFKGKKLILFFYPKANTPACTAEACSLRDAYGELKEKGFELLGVSADSTKKQGNFKKKYGLPFPLLADTEHTAIKAFGVWGPKQMFGKTFEGIYRTTFVIDEQGVIQKVFTEVESANHAEQILNEME